MDKIILGGMGLSNDDYLFFKNSFEAAGALDKIICFINTTENPPVERLLVPDMALTAAEYFAVDKNEKVLVLLTDMTLYADALSIVSNRMDQIPSKDSMPGSLYSDLAKATSRTPSRTTPVISPKASCSSARTPTPARSSSTRSAPCPV